MDQFNIEEQLKRKFKERAITPSPDAWNRVAYNRQNKKKRSKKNLLWYAAACAILTAGIIMFVLMQNNTVNQPIQIQVVAAPQPEQTPQSVPTPITAPADTFTSPAAVAINAHKDIPERVPQQLVMTNEKDSITIIAHNTPLPLPTLELQKANEIAYTLTQMAEKNGEVTQREVDSLLLSAQKEIAMERLKNRSLPTSESALLQEAETEVNATFREKALNIFKHKFKTIRIAGKN